VLSFSFERQNSQETRPHKKQGGPKTWAENEGDACEKKGGGAKRKERRRCKKKRNEFKFKFNLQIANGI
jgi:hypothetical protein